MLAGIILQPGAWDPTRGRLDDVEISNVTMHDVASPFSLTLAPGNTAGRIVVSRMTATGVYRAAASVESWAEEPVETMIFRDVNLEFQGGGRAEQAQLPIRRPAADVRVLPVWGLYAHKVRALELQNVRLNLSASDVRPALIAEEVDSLDLDAFRTPPGNVPALALNGVKGVKLRDTDLKVAAARCIGLDAGGDPFAATGTVESGPQDGLSSVQVSIDGRSQTRWIAMQANERKQVIFTGWEKPGPGVHTVQCGELRKQLTIP